MSISQPNNTLYVSNIDWKIKKPVLRRALYMLMTRHGKVVEIITLRRDGLRGQAWVIFDDVQSATAAISAEQGFTFFGRDLKLAYANEKSDRIAKRDGTYVPKAKRRKLAKGDSAKASADGPTSTASTGNTDGTSSEAAAAQGSSLPPPPPPPPPVAEDTTPPSHILLATELPSDVNDVALGMLFRQYDGFVEVRVPREGLAFIEFDSEPHATLALQRLNGFQLTKTDILKLAYGKA